MQLILNSFNCLFLPIFYSIWKLLLTTDIDLMCLESSIPYTSIQASANGSFRLSIGLHTNFIVDIEVRHDISSLAVLTELRNGTCFL